MKVGTLAETITVTGETPIVDVQSAKRVRTLDNELIQSLPTAKGYASVMLLIPSMVQSGGGIPNVQLSPGMIVFGGQGGRGNEGRVQVDGLNTGASLNGGGVSGYRQDIENVVGNRHDHVRRPGRNGGRRAGHEHRAEDRRQHVRRTFLRDRPQRRRCRATTSRERLIDSGLRAPQPHQLHLRHERVERRSDHQGSAVVLRTGVLPRQRQRHLDVPQHERRRPHQVDLRAPTRTSPAEERQQRPAAAEPAADVPGRRRATS